MSVDIHFQHNVHYSDKMLLKYICRDVVAELIFRHLICGEQFLQMLY